MKAKMFLLVVATAVLTACGPSPAPAPVTAPTPQVVATNASGSGVPQVVVIQQPAAQQSNTSDMLLAGAAGMAAGALLSNAGNSNSRPTYQEPKTVVVNRYMTVPAQAPKPATVMPSATPKPVVDAPALTKAATPPKNYFTSKLPAQTPAQASKLSLTKQSSSSSNSFGGFNKRK